MRYVAALVLSLLATAPAVSEEPVANPGLTATAGGVRDAAHARDIALHRIDVAVRLHGAVAETTVTAEFANDGRDVLEGDFRLALPQDAIVTGYALDVGGQLVDGVLVDQPKARAVYEAQVRRRVDPGLGEVATDGGFRTRVFPIMPGGHRTIRLRFAAPVGPEGFRMPLRLAAPRAGWGVAVTADGTTTAPTLLMPDGQAGRWQGGGSDDGSVAEASGKDALNGAIVIGPVATPDTIASRHRSGERFVQLGGTLPPAHAAGADGTLRIYWDRSRSRLADRHEAEYAVLRRTIAAIQPRRIEVVTFASDGAIRQVAETPEAAIELLRGVRYRGATSFAGVAGDGAADRCLLFSDGRVTIDRASMFAPRCRVDAVTTSATADMGWLRHLATGLGGQAYALGEDGDRIAAALAAATPGVATVTDRDGQRLPFATLPAVAGRWRIVARAPALGGVTVHVGNVDSERMVGEAVPFDGDAALVAADLLATLGETEQRADFIATSRRYGVASPGLSFLVLETPDDYLAADIAPPANYPAERLARFLEGRKAMDGERAEARHTRLRELTGAWAQQVAWWRQRFDPAAAAAKISRSRGRTMPPPTIVAMPAAPLAPPPPPPPAPPPPPPVPAPALAGDIVVSGSRASSSPPTASPGVSAVTIEAWQPDRDYLRAFDAAPVRFDERFAEAERQAGGVPAFYLDTAEWLRRHGRTADAVQMVLSALDLPSANATTLGIVADRLERYGALDRAIELRERQATLEPDRPQPRRLLALALAARSALRPAPARGDRAGDVSARDDLVRAVTLLREVAVGTWDRRWDGIDLIALMEANALVPQLTRLGGANPLEPALTTLLDTDVRVVVDWTTDATDLDLWVDEPGGERAIYSNPRTAIGGHLSNDMTAGYGPEEYFVRRAPAGDYTVRANVYAADRLDPNGLSLLTAHLFRDFGRPTQRVEAVDIELQRDERGEKMIGRIVVPRSTKAR
jgi:hypothetical protein